MGERVFSGNGERLKFVLTKELIPLHCDGDLEDSCAPGFRATENFTEAANADGRVVARKSNQIFDSRAHLDGDWRMKADAARADVTGGFLTADPPPPHLNNFEGKFES